LAWSEPMLTIAGRDRQVSGWCRHCGALGVWAADGESFEWIRPGPDGEMGDRGAEDGSGRARGDATLPPDPESGSEALRGGNDGVSGKVGEDAVREDLHRNVEAMLGADVGEVVASTMRIANELERVALSTFSP